MAALSRGSEPAGAPEDVEIIDHALIAAIEPRSLLLVDAGIAANGGQQAGCEWRIDALEEL